ncbi:uncharacterized protein [Onthophagus taurus]|uniref:uncharacterized protein n=1 Tax=Onthophagus taurus TaxID=166361 RepID=UPI0039BE8064
MVFIRHSSTVFTDRTIMNSLVIFAVCLAVASAGLVPVAPLAKTTVVEGPSSSASVVGPDGSAIVSAQPAGRIVAHENVGAAAVGYSAPFVASPVVSHGVAYATAPVVSSYGYAAAPVVPSVAYASTPYGVAKTLVASPVTASGYPILAPGSGLEGRWIPDINEKLYDDGSYKGEIY